MTICGAIHVVAVVVAVFVDDDVFVVASFRLLSNSVPSV